MIKNGFYMLVILSIISCESSRKVKNDFQTIEIPFAEDKEVFSTDIIDSIEYIILADTDQPIGSVEKMVVEDNKIMLWDNSHKCIWIFDDKGKFINQIAKLGRGPEQYTSLHGFSYTASDKIHINDWRVQKIKTYSLLGELICEEKTDGYVSNYVEFEGLKCFFNHDFEGDGEGKFYFNVKGSDNNAKGYLKYKSPFRFFGNGGDFILKNNESLYLTLPYYDTIYSFENQQLIVKCVLDFGANNYPTQELYNAKTMDEIHNILGRGGYIGNPSNVLISKKHLVLNYGQQIDVYNTNVSTLVYNYITNSLYTYSIFNQGKHEISVGYPLATDGYSFYSLKYLYEIPDTVKERFEEMGYVKHENSNPIIVKYNYKI